MLKLAEARDLPESEVIVRCELIVVSDSRFESSEGCQWLWRRCLVLVADFVDLDRGGSALAVNESVHAVDLLIEVPQDYAQGAECRSRVSAIGRRMYSLLTLYVLEQEVLALQEWTCLNDGGLDREQHDEQGVIQAASQVDEV